MSTESETKNGHQPLRFVAAFKPRLSARLLPLLDHPVLAFSAAIFVSSAGVTLSLTAEIGIVDVEGCRLVWPALETSDEHPVTTTGEGLVVPVSNLPMGISLRASALQPSDLTLHHHHAEWNGLARLETLNQASPGAVCAVVRVLKTLLTKIGRHGRSRGALARYMARERTHSSPRARSRILPVGLKHHRGGGDSAERTTVAMIELVLVQHRRIASMRLARGPHLWLCGALRRHRVCRSGCVLTAATEQLLNTL